MKNVEEIEAHLKMAIQNKAIYDDTIFSNILKVRLFQKQIDDAFHEFATSKVCNIWHD